MRIAVISAMTGVPWGGSEELWFEMAIEARRAGHDVGVALCRPYEAVKPLDALGRIGATVLRPPRVVGRGRWQDLKRNVIDLISDPYQSVIDWRPDVICVSQGTSYDVAWHYSLRALPRMIERQKIPYVVICQANDENLIFSQEVTNILLPFLACADRVAFVAERNRVTAERQLCRRLTNSVVLRNPVNLRDCTEVAWPQEKHVARLACVARLLTAAKGQDALLEALAQLRWPADEWCLDLYGLGADEKYLRSLTQFFGLARNVRFCGQTDDIRRVWADHHMLLLPSRTEGTPLALVEAMLCARPAVVTDVGGNVEWITDGKAGYVAEAPTTASIGKALQRAWSERSAWPEMGRTANAVATELFDPFAGRTLLAIIVEAAQSGPSC